MDYEKIARNLLICLSVDQTFSNVQGVMKVLSMMIENNNNSWEAFIAKKTDEILAQYNMKCSKCNHPITVRRSRAVVHLMNIDVLDV